MVEIAHQRGASLFGVRALAVARAFRKGEETYNELGVLYGRALDGLPLHGALKAGLAFVHACDEGGPCRSFVGVPLMVEAAIRPFPIVGVGLQAFGNLNPDTPYGGLLVSLHLGWMPLRQVAGSTR
jgi:hypothetical protein